MLVMVGSGDEAFVAEAFETAVGEYSDGKVHVIDGENHISILESTAAMTIIADWLDQMQVAANN